MNSIAYEKKKEIDDIIKFRKEVEIRCKLEIANNIIKNLLGDNYTTVYLSKESDETNS